MSGSLILWAPVVMIRACFPGKKLLWTDISLAIAGLCCIVFMLGGLNLQWHKEWLLFYIALGFGSFLVSVLVTTQEPLKFAKATWADLHQKPAMVHTRTLGRAFTTAITEEFMWRFIFQTLLTAAIGWISAWLFVAMAFALLHRHRTPLQSIRFVELLGFSVLLGLLFAATRDLTSVVLVHAIRNYLIEIGKVST